jgi:ribose 5-phosphate isomerase B
MKIAIAADHAGFALKEKLRLRLAQEGYEVADFGTHSAESCDYPDFAGSVAREVAQGRSDRGILVCSTGIGMAIAANKVAGVRAAPAESEDEVRLTREHNDANVLTLGARYLDEQRAGGLIDIFLHTDFSGGRHARRVAKIAQLEQGS